MSPKTTRPIPRPAKSNKAILVLGMHRSGTSALTGLLEMFGSATPREQIGASPQNPRGFFEAKRIARLDDSLLAHANLTWDSWRPMPSVKDVPELFEQAQEVLRDEFGDAALIALKDPRICRLVPFWTEVIQAWGRVPFFLLTMRHPLEVAQSLHIRNKFELSHGLLMWMTYVLEAEASTRGAHRTFTTYDLLMKDPLTVAGQVHDLLDLPMPPKSEEKLNTIKSFLSPELRHHEVSDLEDLPLVIRRTYEIFTRWAHTGEDLGDHLFLDQSLLQLRKISEQPDEAENLLDALKMLDNEIPLSEQITAIQKLRKPELVAQTTALVRANAALNAGLGVAKNGTNDINKLKQTIRDQAQKLLSKDGDRAVFDKEFAALVRLFVDTKNTKEKLQNIVLANAGHIKKLSGEVDKLEADRAALRTKRDHLEKINSELHALVAKVEGERARLQGENTELHALVAKVETERAQLQGENTELHALVAKVETERHALASSISWRLTRPVRLVGRLLRGGRR